MSDSRFIAIDWGTTNRRAWLVEDGRAIATYRDDRGVSGMGAGDYPEEIARLRARFGHHRVLAAGMVGSSRGWHEAPYVACPAGAPDLAARLCPVADDVWIVPGVSYVGQGRADVMRGEEIQFIGAVASQQAPGDALLLQPGTHSKWAWMRKGQISSFATAMTGEIFGLLRRHSVLSEMMTQPVDPDSSAFASGIARGSAGEDLSHALFEVRAATLLGSRGAAEGASFVSGLLIGHEIAAHRTQAAEGVYLIAEGPLAAAYSRALSCLGLPVHTAESERVFIAGITLIQETLR